MIIQALVINFFLNLSGSDRPESIDSNDYYSDNGNDWNVIFYSLMVWTSLYRNVHSLNVMLCEPLQPRSPRYLLDGPLVIYLAMRQFEEDCTNIEKCASDCKFPPETMTQCDKLLKLILSREDFDILRAKN